MDCPKRLSSRRSQSESVLSVNMNLKSTGIDLFPVHFIIAMYLPSVIPLVLLLLCTACSTLAASSWSFSDGTLNVQGKGSGVGGGIKEK